MFSLVSIFKHNRLRISFTLTLVIIESLLDLLYPLFIGLAVNDLVKGEYAGLIYLALLGITTLAIGSARRFYDTRVYSKIYIDISSKMIRLGREQDLSVSKLTARSDLLTELIEFFEQSMPAICLSIIGVFGTLIVIAIMDHHVFYACIGLFALVAATYTLTGSTQYFYHSRFNQVLEQRVDTLSGGSNLAVRGHFMQLMRWNVKLSDMETLNFGLIWLGIICLFVATPFLAINPGAENIAVGTILSLLIYVFDYSEKVASLPIYIQQLIRLKEISNRLNQVEDAVEH